jgi:hypothetical protein
MKPITYLIIVVCSGLLAGCAATMPPMELLDARQAFARASAGQAAQLAPAEVQRAYEALAIAEKSFQDEPGSNRTRDLAILAYRKAKLAEALAVKATMDVQSSRTETAKER